MMMRRQRHETERNIVTKFTLLRGLLDSMPPASLEASPSEDGP
jgi:hypothetical protein